jgi:hypothetical protein
MHLVRVVLLAVEAPPVVDVEVAVASIRDTAGAVVIARMSFP